MSRSVVCVLHAVLIAWMIASLTLQPLVAVANDIKYDPGFGGNGHMSTTPSGATMQNIATPSGAGVSANYMERFDVGNAGVVLNNLASGLADTKVGGAILPNPNLVGHGPARIILNQVTSGGRTTLEGGVEIGGTRAEFVLANPNGITCSGCGFINMSRATVTTGTPTITGGALTSIDVDGGDVLVEGLGLDATETGFFEILSRTADIQANMHGETLAITTGRNVMDYATGTVTAKAAAGGAPAVAIDSSALGGMYADRIRLTATEAGVGVNMQGDMATSAAALEITADGRIDFRKAASVTDIVVESVSSDVVVGDDVYAERKLELTAGNEVAIAAPAPGETITAAAGETVKLSGPRVTVTEASVVAGVDRQGSPNGKAARVEVEATDRLTNTRGLIASGDDIQINAENVENNEGVIAAVNDMVIEGVAPGTQSTSVTNRSGVIETINNDLIIRTASLTNQKINFAIAYNQLPGLGGSYGPNSGSPPSAFGQTPEAMAYMNDGSSTYIPHLLRPDDPGVWYDEGSLSSGVWESYVAVDSQQGVIGAGRDLIIDGGTILNSQSVLSSGRDMVLTGATLTNVGYRYERQMRIKNNTHPQFNRCAGPTACEWFGNNDYAWKAVDSVFGPTEDSFILAGGTLTGDFTGLIDNTTIFEGVPADSNLRYGAIERIRQGDAIAPSVRTLPHGPGAVDESGLALARFDPAAQRLFTRTQGDIYLFETNPLFAELGNFVGSDYFLDYIGQDEDFGALPKRLGDAFFDTRLIRDQVRRASGLRFLDGASDDADQMRRLIEQAGAENTRLDLSVGVSLTEEQVAALTQDIVWYVTEEYEGEEVLVPKLYLAPSTEKQLERSQGGAVIAAADVNLNGGEIRNSGVITARSDVTLDSEGSVTNAGGEIEADKKIRLVAQNGDVLNVTDTQTLTNAWGDRLTRELARGKITAGDTVTMVAARDIGFVGADLQSGGDSQLDAGGDVTVATNVVGRTYRQEGGGVRIFSDRNTNIASNLTTGGDLSVDSRGDVTVAGSTLAAGEDLEVTADGSVTIASVVDTSESEVEARSGGFLKKSHVRGKSQTSTNRSSTLAAGNDVTIRSGADTTVLASNITAARDVDIDVGTSGDGSLNVLSAQDVEISELEAKRSGFSPSRSKVASSLFGKPASARPAVMHG